MPGCCFACNASVTGTIVHDILAECNPNGTTLAQLLSEIFDKTVPETDLYSKVICTQCCNTCKHYYDVKNKLLQIKTNLTNNFKSTLLQNGYNYNTFPNKTAPKKIVLPASKLQPLPPDYVINGTRLSRTLSPQKNTSPKILNVTNLISQIPVTSSANTALKIKTEAATEPDNTIIETTVNKTLATILNSKSTNSNSVVTYNVNSLPKDFMSNAVVKCSKIGDKSDVMKDVERINSEKRTMQIGEDCTLVQVTESEDNLLIEEKIEKEAEEPEFLDMSLLPEGEGEDDDGEETQTIVVTGENGSILHIMSGQKLVYQDGVITLQSEDDNSNHDDNNDGHDSNDESQIELQVSGDEETANAIIAAAQEQGGAFIKVESGEMFRVKSVQSKTGDPKDILLQIVAQEGDNFKCLLCAKGDKDNQSSTDPLRVLRDAESMMAHLKIDHDARIYICHFCKKIIRRRCDYTAHLAEHTSTSKTGKLVIETSGEKGKMHECTQCKKKYNSRMLLQEHLNVHSGNRPYICSVCKKSFASKYSHQAHLKTHSERPRPFKCEECSKTFLSMQNLNQHAKTHSGIKDFICNICDKAFSTQHNLEVHGVVHSGSRPFVCGFCGKAFARRAEVRDHMRTHTGERPYSCDICEATFAQRSNLASHRRATHFHDARYACPRPGCLKRFKRRRLLEYHIKATHTGERPLECKTCHATFVYPEHYKKHQRIHSGEKPYVCEVCGKSFNSRDNRNTHRFVHSDKKPYECLACGAGYMRKQLLYAHMNSTGHLAESIVVNQPRVQKVKEKIIIETNEDSQMNTSTDQTEATVENANSPKVFLTENKQFILQDGKSTINIVQDANDPTMLTLIHNLEKGVESDGTLQGISTEQLEEQQVQMVTSDENGTIRLVQLHINANPETWVFNED